MKNITDIYGRDLDLNLLRVFTVVAEERSLTRAAARLYVTQPAVSASMRRLTDFVGADLVTRQGRGVALTARGNELLGAARSYLLPLLAATMATAAFDPAKSTATIRLGIADGLESALLPALLAKLREAAPHFQLVVRSVQFRTVEDLLLTNQVDLAVTVADDLPRSILRQPLVMKSRKPGGFVCLYDSRFVSMPKKPSEKDYFAQEHVIVSYAGDVRGIVEDLGGKARTVRVSVPAFGYLPDVVDGSALVATLPALFARSIVKTRPHLRMAPVPFSVDPTPLELLWSRVTDADAASRFVRDLVVGIPL